MRLPEHSKWRGAESKLYRQFQLDMNNGHMWMEVCGHGKAETRPPLFIGPCVAWRNLDSTIYGINARVDDCVRDIAKDI